MTAQQEQQLVEYLRLITIAMERIADALDSDAQANKAQRVQDAMRPR